MEAPASPTPWPLLAPHWEDLFPLRATRVDLTLALSAPGERCLDAGCATGALPRAWASHGRIAHGLDLEPSFLAVGRARAHAEGHTIQWHEASLLDLASQVGSQRFRLITCLGQTLPHLLEEGEWLSFFRQAKALLTPGGALVIQAVHDGDLAVGEVRELPPLRCAAGMLERRRVVLSSDHVRFETRFTPVEGLPLMSHVLHRRMAPAAAAELLVRAGFIPDPPLADEGGSPFHPKAPGWVIVAR